jgi:hypothetical protein
MGQDVELKNGNDEITSSTNNVITTVNDHQNKSSINLKLQNSDEEELLGSVRTYLTDGPTVRTSARVIHKLREISSASSAPSPQPEKSVTETSSNTPKTPSQTKIPYVKVQWINSERNHFYDALNEYGRDFEKISHFINMKMRRKSPTDTDYKTKDHVRHLYYQLYSKASKYLRFSSDVMKTAQELYTVINYAEMKRKLVIVTEKSFLKLRELVYRGSTVIRYKGKNIRIKTPSCRALRKLNQLEGIDEDVLLPHRIDVVIRPGSFKSWGYVQSLAQNPRIKLLSLPLQKRLATLLMTIQQKWQTNNIRMYDKYVKSCIRRQGVQKVGEEIVNQSQNDMIQLKREAPVLNLKPPKELRIHRPMVQLNELLSSDNLCLNSYEERIGATVRGEPLCPEKLIHIKDLQRNATKRARNDSASEKSAKLLKTENDIKAEATTMKVDMEAGISVIDCKSNDSNEKTTSTDDNNVPQIKIEENSNGNGNVNVEEDVKVETKPPPPPPPPQKKRRMIEVLPVIKLPKQEQNYKPLIDEETLKQVRQGWTLENVGDVTIGDLYLMFGSDCRLTLEYEVSPASEIKNETDVKIGGRLKSLVAMATLMEGASNPILSNFFTKHTCEKPEQNHIEFKLPRTDLYHKMTSKKLIPARWWQQKRAPVMSALPGNHVIRDLYSTPKPNVENQNLQKLNEEVREEEVQKIIEDKIQNLSEDKINNFSDNSRSSMRSLLDCLALSNTQTIDNFDNGKFVQPFLY